MRGGRFSPRRRLLLGAVLLMLALMLVLRGIGIAGFNGTEAVRMDWNSDGQVTRGELLQGYSVVKVSETRDGPRTCRHYARLRAPDQPLRVDCRVEFAPADADAD